MTEFLQRVEKNLHARRLFPRGARVLVAVSGGVDSIVLLHALHALAGKYRWQLVVAHFNHHLRGRASDADEQLVRLRASKLGLKFFAGGADVKTFSVRLKISVEMAARKLRHEFLAQIARKQKIPVIALAHHADDQVELFFLRVLRGAGSEGLAGMKWRSLSPADGRVQIVRPLLAASKEELLAFAKENKIHFREDVTNAASDFLRNRIRNELLPLLRKNYQPAVDKMVLRLMDILGAESDFVGQSAKTFSRYQVGKTKLAVRKQTKTNRFEEISFEAQPVALQRRILQDGLLAAGVPVDFDLVESLRSKPDMFVSIGKNLAAARNHAGTIKIQRPALAKFKVAEYRLNLSGGEGVGKFGGINIRWKVQPMRRFALPPKSAGTEFFDADLIGPEIILRHWQAGDRFQPIGLKSAVKLQDLFVNAKIPAARRRELVLASTSAGDIFWGEGLRIAEKFKLTPRTRTRLAWKWSKIAR